MQTLIIAITTPSLYTDLSWTIVKKCAYEKRTLNTKKIGIKLEFDLSFAKLYEKINTFLRKEKVNKPGKVHAEIIFQNGSIRS